MGNFCGSCFKGEPESQLVTPDLETKRILMAQAAAKRLQEQESRGIKNPENVKRKQQQALERERAEHGAGGSGHNLRWAQD